jgi:hypothetical protein
MNMSRAVPHTRTYAGIMVAMMCISAPPGLVWHVHMLVHQARWHAISLHFQIVPSYTCSSFLMLRDTYHRHNPLDRELSRISLARSQFGSAEACLRHNAHRRKPQFACGSHSSATRSADCWLTQAGGLGRPQGMQILTYLANTKYLLSPSLHSFGLKRSKVYVTSLRRLCISFHT